MGWQKQEESRKVTWWQNMGIISETALFLRLKRWFSREYGEFLHKTRPGKSKQYLGDYFTVDEATNAIVDRMLNLEIVGRQRGILKKARNYLIRRSIKSKTTTKQRKAARVTAAFHIINSGFFP
jgi:hypothetical protein